ncbi:mannose-1-phosphate guanylyltransferase/mannose-6-phosphate isomerase [Pleionea mediterranea]|uniref:mannose-1-phosphate guanylyltransferase n=1 Tax=Pleionea mediterranea TaxID=523701 RepID=A0A316FQ02_9GAMM|nr:mannose-1-phosphate guanylyltransferase/mannose-6-phosphate isomerase [Pleionea mediterranea]
MQLTGKVSLFQQTLQRCGLLSKNKSGFDVQPPVVVSNEQYRFLIAQQALEVGQPLTTIILESSTKNTAPALTLAAEYIKQHYDNALMLVLPADHAIELPLEFVSSTLHLCQALKAHRSIGIFGVTPDFAHTGYGYIEMGKKQDNGINQVSSFTEKPKRAVAEAYLAAGNYFWNSGMFIVQSYLWLEALVELNVDIHKACHKAMENSSQDLEFVRVDAEAFESSPSESIDYAVIEKIPSLKNLNISVDMVPLNCEWTDLGAWTSVSDQLKPDENGNVAIGDVIQEQSTNTFVMSQQRLVATLGVNDLVVVETPDAVLVANKSKVQNVKQIVAQLKKSGRSEHQVHRRVYRPWGNYEIVDVGEGYKVKRIEVNPEASLSLQLHHQRAEHWIVVTGAAEVSCDDKTFLLSENQSTYIPIGSKHRLSNPGKLPLELIEVQSGSYLGEDDIERLDDIYGRKGDTVIG